MPSAPFARSAPLRACAADASINANGARLPAKLDRPDQHIYQIMAEKGPLANAPYVLMATTGAAGRFNRAQVLGLELGLGFPRFNRAQARRGRHTPPVIEARQT